MSPGVDPRFRGVIFDSVKRRHTGSAKNGY